MSDLISRQAAIDAVMEFMPSLTTPDGSGQFDREIFEAQEMFVDIGQALSKLPSAQPEQRWIPCSDRLPLEQEADYWICTDTGYQCQCRWTRNRYGLGIYDKWGWKLIDIPQYTHVIAWQPLLEPYKADMRGEEQ